MVFSTSLEKCIANHECSFLPLWYAFVFVLISESGASVFPVSDSMYLPYGLGLVITDSIPTFSITSGTRRGNYHVIN